MTKNQEPNQKHDLKKQELQSLESLIRDNVMYDLGQPARLLHVQVRSLWGNNYRVNVYVGDDVASAKVTDSFFLEADGNGKVLVSTPAITRRYERKLPVSEK